MEERGARRYDHWVPECLFCGIASGEIPAKIVGESSRTIAFRDIDPQAPIHILVIPKEHYSDVAAVVAAGGGLLEEMAAMAHSAAVAEGIGESGYRVVLNSGPDAGQDVSARPRARARRPAASVAARLVPGPLGGSTPGISARSPAGGPVVTGGTAGATVT